MKLSNVVPLRVFYLSSHITNELLLVSRYKIKCD